MGRLRRMLLVVAALVAIAVVAGGAWYATRDRGTTSVDATDAAKLVDAEADAEVDAGARPPAGTYTYVGSGKDHFSALGGAGHEFPDEVSVVVELDADDDCAWTMHVVFVEEHVEERRLCTEGGVVRERGFDRTTEFLGRRQTSTYECTEGAIRMPADPRRGESWSWTCTEARGGEVSYTGTLVGSERTEVGGEPMDVRRVRVVGVQDDESVGRETTELWLRPDGLPVRFTTDRKLTVNTPLGSMTTTEEWDYECVERSAPV